MSLDFKSFDIARLVVGALVTLLLAAGLVPLVRRVAFRIGAIDRPSTRRVHEVPTARLGGLAVAGAAFASGAGAGMLGELEQFPALLPLVAGVVIVLVVGMVDDIVGVRARIKVLVELAAAWLVVYAGDCRMEAVSIFGSEVELGVLSQPLSMLWIVVATNAINLIDGLDGLAAGTAAIAFSAIAIVAVGFSMPGVALLAAICAGSCLGFLVHNLHPASIFLGDGGSLPLGFALGVLSTYARAKGTTGAITLAPLLLVAWPLGDLLWAVSRRYRPAGRPLSLQGQASALKRLFEPDKNHIHHRLLALGLGQRSAALLLYGIQALTCATAVYFLVGR